MWAYIAVLVVAVIASYALRPKPESTPPAGVSDIEAPTAEEGREIPVLFGTRDIKGPNVIWWGHLRTVAVKKKGGKK